MAQRITWRQRLHNLTGDRTKEAQVLAKQVVDEGTAHPVMIADDHLLASAKEAVAEAHGDGVAIGNADPTTELASPKHVVDVAVSDSEVDQKLSAFREATFDNKDDLG
jgi:hypothetical protein